MLFTSTAPCARLPLGRRPPASRCLICDKDVFCGVGASGSTMISTNVSFASVVLSLVNDTCGRMLVSGRNVSVS